MQKSLDGKAAKTPAAKSRNFGLVHTKDLRGLSLGPPAFPDDGNNPVSEFGLAKSFFCAGEAQIGEEASAFYRVVIISWPFSILLRRRHPESAFLSYG